MQALGLWRTRRRLEGRGQPLRPEPGALGRRRFRDLQVPRGWGEGSGEAVRREGGESDHMNIIDGVVMDCHAYHTCIRGKGVSTVSLVEEV